VKGDTVLTIIAKMQIKSGREGEAEAALRDMIAYVSRAEPGTLRYTLHRGIGDPAQLLIYEQYADQSAVDTHGTSERIQHLFATLAPLLDGQPSIEMYEEVAGKR
jgi:quinol monooxygenase YgiN